MNRSCLLLIFFQLTITFFCIGQISNPYLEKVLANLEQVESATYLSTREGWNPGDTIPVSVATSPVRSYRNEKDTSIGASWVELDLGDTTHLKFAYDGNMRTLIYDESRRMYLDSFNVRKLPFRPVNVPFYYRAEDIIAYALQTQDSIVLEQINNDDHVHYRLAIHEDTQVEFFGKAHHIPKPPYYVEPTSIYELWIDKTTNLPYQIRREMSHNISVEAVSESEFNKLDINTFTASDYFPKDYEIRSYKEMYMRRQSMSDSDSTIKIAPEWQLLSTNNQMIGLSDLKSKLVLLQFTSVGCGPCRASVPFLNELQTTYGADDLAVVAIECTARNATVLRKYKERNNLEFPFLLMTKEDNLIKEYHVEVFPMFYLLDEERSIHQVFRGYGSGTTDEQIIKSIDKKL